MLQVAFSAVTVVIAVLSSIKVSPRRGFHLPWTAEALLLCNCNGMSWKETDVIHDNINMISQNTVSCLPLLRDVIATPRDTILVYLPVFENSSPHNFVP